MTTALSTARADATICRAATRALRRGDGPREVTTFLSVYAGLPTNDYLAGYTDGYHDGYTDGYTHEAADPTWPVPVATLPGRERKRWWAR